MESLIIAYDKNMHWIYPDLISVLSKKFHFLWNGPIKVMYIDLALVLSQALQEDKQNSTGGYLYTLTLLVHKNIAFLLFFKYFLTLQRVDISYFGRLNIFYTN